MVTGGEALLSTPQEAAGATQAALLLSVCTSAWENKKLKKITLSTKD